MSLVTAEAHDLFRDDTSAASSSDSSSVLSSSLSVSASYVAATGTSLFPRCFGGLFVMPSACLRSTRQFNYRTDERSSSSLSVSSSLSLLSFKKSSRSLNFFLAPTPAGLLLWTGVPALVEIFVPDNADPGRMGAWKDDARDSRNDGAIGASVFSS